MFNNRSTSTSIWSTGLLLIKCFCIVNYIFCSCSAAWAFTTKTASPIWNASNVDLNLKYVWLEKKITICSYLYLLWNCNSFVFSYLYILSWFLCTIGLRAQEIDIGYAMTENIVAPLTLCVRLGCIEMYLTRACHSRIWQYFV